MNLSSATAEEYEQHATLTEVEGLEPVPVRPHVVVGLTRSARRHRVVAALLASDVTALLAAVSLTGIAHQRGETLTPDSMMTGGGSYVVLSVTFALITLLVMRARHLYDVEKLGWGSAEFTRLLRSVLLGVMATAFVTLLFDITSPSVAWIVLITLSCSTFLVCGRVLLRFGQLRVLRRGGWLHRPTLIVGSNVEAAEVARLLRSNPSAGLVPVGCLRSSLKDRLSFDYCAPSVPMLGTARDLPDIVQEYAIDTVIIVASAFDYEVVKRIIKELRGLSVAVHISSALSEVLHSRVLTREISGIPLISLKGVPLSPANLRLKRAFDVALAGLLVVAGMPLWLTLAALIRINSKGPVFYRQERIGRAGVPFLMYKFRSMVVDADKRLRELQEENEADGPLFKMRDDPRVTSVGRWMRKLSLDEFPQLINVLLGEMSLVGPRPPLPTEILLYAPEDWRRLEVPPGMTGLWQVSGRSNLTFRDMVRLDCFYIDNWSPGLDMSLLLRTVPAVVSARGAC